jgi:hypothetical protein
MSEKMNILSGMAEDFVSSRPKKHKLMVDRYLMTFPEVRQLVEYLDSKMVLNVSVNDVNGSLLFQVTTLNLGSGERLHSFEVTGLNEHNRNVLIDNVLEIYGE